MSLAKLILIASSLVWSTLASAGTPYPAILDQHCTEVENEEPPDTDVVTSEDQCDSFDLYYDAKNKQYPSKKDWLEVRKCAFSQTEHRVLMMLYANGSGVKQNHRLALHYACKLDQAPAEFESRIRHLASEIGAETHQAFDWCDDVRRSENIGICMSIEERQKERVRRITLDRITAKWTAPQKALFDDLEKALENFISYRGNIEAEQIGTARYYDAIRVSAEELDTFVGYFENLEQRKLPNYSSKQYSNLDKALNQTYKKALLTSTNNELEAIKEGIRATQKSWLQYRDAWDALIRVKYPSVEPQSWKALLTELRIKQLKELAGELE